MKNCIVETNGEGVIVKIFPFEAEIEKTEFYSGLLVFYPSVKVYVRETVLKKLQYIEFGKIKNSDIILPEMKYTLYIENDFVCGKKA